MAVKLREDWRTEVGCADKKKIVVTLPKCMEGEVDACCVEVKFCADTTEPTVCVKDPCVPAEVQEQVAVANLALATVNMVPTGTEDEVWVLCCCDDTERVPDEEVPCIVKQAEAVYKAAKAKVEAAGYELVDVCTKEGGEAG